MSSSPLLAVLPGEGRVEPRSSAGPAVEEAFGPPSDSAATYRLARQVLSDVFSPATAFLPAGDMDYSLRRPRACSVGELLAEVRSKVVAHAVHPRHPMAIAHMVPPPCTVGVVADLVIGALNQCAFCWEEAPAAAELETEVLRWMAARLGYVSAPGSLLTSGGTMGNYIAALLALERAKRREPGAAAFCIVASDQAHLSIEKAAVMLGLGRDAVVRVATDAEGRVVPGSFAEAARACRDADRTPFLLVCTAGTSTTGALEPAAEILRVARRCGAWCHVDAAHGGLVSLAHGHRATTAAWTTADSVSWDAHKTLYAPYAVGALFVRDPSELEVLDFRADYALRPEDELDAGIRHLDGSRRLEALKLWMCIRYFGLEGYRSLTERTLETARRFADAIRENDQLVLATEPDTNIVCFRFEDSTLSHRDNDRVNLRAQSRLFRTGGPLLSTARVGGCVNLRSVLLNPRFSAAHIPVVIDRVLREAEHHAGRLGRGWASRERAAR